MARREVASARNLQNLTRVVAHSAYIDLCDARLQTIDGDFQGAIDLLTIVRGAGPYPRGHFSQPLVDLEIAYCRVKLGHRDALRLTPSLEQLVWLDELDVDDKLSAIWMLAELSRDDDSQSNKSADSRLTFAIAEYDNWLLALQTQLSPFAEY